MCSLNRVQYYARGALFLLALCTSRVSSAYWKEGGRESAVLTFEYQNGTVSTAVAAMGTFGDQPYARELRCSVLPYSSLLFDCGDDCDHACRAPGALKDDLELPNGLFCLFVTMKGSRSCPFYKQALNAQKLGAAAVVLLDDSYMLQIPTYPPTSEAVDGQANVTIPVVSTLKTRNTDALASGSVIALLDGKALPSAVIDFTSSLTQTDKVEVVFYGTERDHCEASMGSYCNRKIEFLRMIAGWMVSLAKEGAIRFRYRSLVVTCDNMGRRHCETDCTNRGRYCVRRPPTGVNTTGADIVKLMAFSECVSQLADLSDEPSLWWDFKLIADRRCTMVTNSLTLECAEEVVRSLEGDTRLAGGIRSIKSCMGSFDDNSENDVLEKAFQDSLGNDEVSEIMFDPTYVINGVQYMGRWTRGAWFEAVCAGFRPGREPDLCLDPEISFDECAPGEYGDVLCKLGEAAGLTSCRNTFRGFSCECDPARFITVRNTEDEDATPECRDRNECLTLSLDEDCTCERCACHNTYGGYECEANIPNKCQAHSGTAYNQCWSAVINDREYTACVDDIAEYKDKAARGEIRTGRNGGFLHDILQTCKCPEGFEGDGVKECTPVCSGDSEFFVQGAGCVTKAQKAGVGALIGWIVMSIASVILGLVALKLYTDKRRLAKERTAQEPLLNQKLLEQIPQSDTIGVCITPDRAHNEDTSCPPGETELGIIRENNA